MNDNTFPDNVPTGTVHRVLGSKYIKTPWHWIRLGGPTKWVCGNCCKPMVAGSKGYSACRCDYTTDAHSYDTENDAHHD